MTSQTVTHRLYRLFSVFGMPVSIYSDRGASFVSADLRIFLLKKGVTSSHITACNPQANGQLESIDDILRCPVTLSLTPQVLVAAKWESVLLYALPPIRLLSCVKTNTNPHERLFAYNHLVQLTIIIIINGNTSVVHTNA
ncbi:uncharacterized protein DEA37_0003160 [Paragonimus westermani]|uniref:Integrase catalytic domain-containing protein n=1 Tax=Paragonimus westermani TaxID=34504 RepID=A0A5J4NLN6_9TREM|nr:uncharacterized protein DEA37_0003160 [Paragonimus westermani]